MHMLKVLAEPANLEQSSHPATFRRNRWQIGHNPFFQESLSGQIPPARRSAAYWLGRRYVMDLASFCQRSIDSYYRRVGRGQAQHKACFFVEKFEPGHVPNMIWELYPEAREVILIRDFRDQLCSILSLNARRGYAAFGRDRVGSDEEYVSWLGRATLHLLKSWRRRSGQAHLVRYEDLVFRPETTIASLLGYLQLDPAPEIIHGMMEQAAAGTPELARHATVPDPRASVGRWQRDLSPVFQALCADTFGDLLREFGYSVAGDDGTAASPGGG